MSKIWNSVGTTTKMFLGIFLFVLIVKTLKH